MRPLLPALASSLALVAGSARAACPRTDLDALPERVTMKDFGEALEDRVGGCAGAARRPDALAFFAAHRLDPTEARVRDYVRVRTLFEMTRDGGPWRVRWAITNQDATAKNVWAAWTRATPAVASSAPSATAECDEISALFAGLVRRTGTRNVGLFWPTWNHTIAAWDVTPQVRVLIPTTQIFLECDDGFDHAPAFSPTKQRVVYEFPASDVPDRTTMPRALAAFLLDRVTDYAPASLEVLATIRTHRALAYGSSLPEGCREGAARRARAIAGAPLAAADRAALSRYAEELGIAPPTAEAALARIAAPSK